MPGPPQPIGIGSSLSGIGAPWALDLGSGNFVDGHDSDRPGSQPLEIHSPYFGDNAHSRMQAVTA